MCLFFMSDPLCFLCFFLTVGRIFLNPTLIIHIFPIDFKNQISTVCEHFLKNKATVMEKTVALRALFDLHGSDGVENGEDHDAHVRKDPQPHIHQPHGNQPKAGDLDSQ